ncbi:MAG: guanylate kinase [Proteobacteria bacterium]|nr:guanylate kinase [Pseudomonadota bacterium]
MMANRRGLMLVLSSPSGAGKTTLSRRLSQSDPNTSLSISVTTRPPRPDEADGDDYIFVSEEEFARMIEAGELLEYATVFGHSYGTPRPAVEAHLEAGRDVMFDIDWQGTQQLQDKSKGDVVRIFILPPSMAALEERLRSRGQDSNETVASRMQQAATEISHWAEYDYVLINRDFDECLAEIKEILEVERMRRSRRPGLVQFVKQLVEDAES